MLASYESLHVTKRGTGVPFLFQHGLGARLEQPQGLLSDVSGVELISMDCPGQGQSPLPSNKRPSFSWYTQLLYELSEKLEIENAIVGGISMGAGISIHFALHYPEKVKALVLVRPAWLDRPNPENLSILLTAAGYMGSPSGKNLFEQTDSFTQLAKELPSAAQSVMGVFGLGQQKEIPLVLRSMVGDAPFQEMDQLKKINVPCLIIGNDDDPLHPFSMAETLSTHLAESQLEKVVSRYIDNAQHKTTLTQIVSTFIHTL